MTGLSKSQRARQAQYLDLRTRGYSIHEASTEVDRTDRVIDAQRVAERTTSVTGHVAAHPEHANAIIVFLDSPAVPKFKAGARVNVRSEIS